MAEANITDYSSFSKEKLNKINKNLLVDYILNLDDKNLNNEIKNILNDMNDKISKLNDRLLIKDNVIDKLKEENTNLKDRIILIENDINETERYIRRNNIVIDGIPDEVRDASLQATVTEIAKSLDINVQEHEFEACHRLRSKPNRKGPRRTVVRFVNRRKVEKLLERKKHLKNTSFNESSKLHNTRLFFSDHLCPYFSKLFGMCQKLRFNNKLHSVWSYNGEVYYKITVNQEKGKKVTNEQTLKNDFPGFFM